MTGGSCWRPSMSTDAYDARWRELAEAGHDPHGEVAFIQVYGPTSVLDAGCGTGRVAIELAHRGVDVVGVDLDEPMLAAARAKAPELTWIYHDLAGLDLGRTFNLVAMAGNVMIFVEPSSRAEVMRACARHLDVSGLVVAGFQLGRGLSLAEYDALAEAAGFTLVERFATWERLAFAGGDYAVSVHHLEVGQAGKAAAR